MIRLVHFQASVFCGHHINVQRFEPAETGSWIIKYPTPVLFVLVWKLVKCQLLLQYCNIIRDLFESTSWPDCWTHYCLQSVKLGLNQLFSPSAASNRCLRCSKPLKTKLDSKISSTKQLKENPTADIWIWERHIEFCTRWSLQRELAGEIKTQIFKAPTTTACQSCGLGRRNNSWDIKIFLHQSGTFWEVVERRNVGHLAIFVTFLRQHVVLPLLSLGCQSSLKGQLCHKC